VWGLSPAEWIGNGYLGSHFAAYTPFWDTEAAALGPALGRDFAGAVGGVPATATIGPAAGRELAVRSEKRRAGRGL